MTQQKQVIKYFKENQNKSMHFKAIANELNILVPNMRRILGQGTLKGIFTRVAKGLYKLNDISDYKIQLVGDKEFKRKKELSELFNNNAKYYDNFNEYGIRYKGISIFNKDLTELYNTFLKLTK